MSDDDQNQEIAEKINTVSHLKELLSNFSSRIDKDLNAASDAARKHSSYTRKTVSTRHNDGALPIEPGLITSEEAEYVQYAYQDLSTLFNKENFPESKYQAVMTPDVVNLFTTQTGKATLRVLCHLDPDGKSLDANSKKAPGAQAEYALIMKTWGTIVERAEAEKLAEQQEKAKPAVAAATPAPTPKSEFKLVADRPSKLAFDALPTVQPYDDGSRFASPAATSVQPVANTTGTPAATPTPAPIASATPKATSTPAASPSATVTTSPSPTATLSPTATATPKATASASPSATVAATAAPTPSATAKASPKPTPVVSPSPTATASPSPSAAATASPSPSASPKASPSPTATAAAIPKTAPTPTPAVTPAASPKATPEAAPVKPVATPAATPATPAADKTAPAVKPEAPAKPAGLSKQEARANLDADFKEALHDSKIGGPKNSEAIARLIKDLQTLDPNFQFDKSLVKAGKVLNDGTVLGGIQYLDKQELRRMSKAIKQVEAEFDTTGTVDKSLPLLRTALNKAIEPGYIPYTDAKIKEIKEAKKNPTPTN